MQQQIKNTLLAGLLSLAFTIAPTAHAALVAHLLFDGSTADTSGNGNNGTFIGGAAAYVTGVDGTPNGALWLNGTDQYVAIAQNSGLLLSTIGTS